MMLRRFRSKVSRRRKRYSITDQKLLEKFSQSFSDTNDEGFIKALRFFVGMR